MPLAPVIAVASKKKWDLKFELQRIHGLAEQMEVARATAEKILVSIQREIIGRRVQSYRTGNLKGEYQITDIDLSYNGQITAHGRKVMTDGKLGAKRWDLGSIYPGRLDL